LRCVRNGCIERVDLISRLFFHVFLLFENGNWTRSIDWNLTTGGITVVVVAVRVVVWLLLDRPRTGRVTDRVRLNEPTSSKLFWRFDSIFVLFWFLLPSFYLAFFFSIAPRTFSIFQKSHCIEIRRGLGKENKQNKKRKGTRRRRRRRRRISASKRRKIVVTLSLGSVT